jgi:hypothetical protein
VLDLFQRRFEVFQELTRTITTAFNKADVDGQDLFNFETTIEKARFLFGREVHKYLAESRQRMFFIIMNQHALRSTPDGPQRANAEKKVLDALDEMNRFYEGLATLVTPYMRVGQPADPWRSLLDRVQGPTNR